MTGKTFEFEIGKTLEDTAAQVRFPLSGDNDYGLISASSPIFPKDVYGTYMKPGYEVTIGPLSWIMFHSDTKRYPNKLANAVSLNIDTNQRGFTTYIEMYNYAYALIDQFQRGKWKRYIPDECPRVSGKTSVINDDEIKALAKPGLKNWLGFDCPLDPGYKPSLEEWKTMMDEGQTYMWRDEENGRLAKFYLSVSKDGKDGSLRSITDIIIDLEFELEESYMERIAGNRDAELKEPWGERVRKVEIEKLRIRDILEQRAGISVHPDTSAPLYVKAGLPCPRAGIWQAQDVKAEKRSHKEGEIMADLHSAYGTTVWRWIE